MKRLVPIPDNNAVAVEENDSSESVSIWAPNFGKGALCSNGSFRSDESDCAKYYHCVNNEWVTSTCPGGLHWNRVIYSF